MICIVNIKKEGNGVVAYLPFDPRTEFHIPKGAIYVKCVLENIQFKSKLMSKGNGRYCIFFSKQLLKEIGIDGDEKLNVYLNIEPDISRVIHSLIEIPETSDNEVLKAIFQRASIRGFSNKDVTQVQINTILNAGLCAPSATNKRPFHFIVSKDREKMVNIIGDNHYVRVLKSATACIIVCGDKVVQRIPEWLLADCSAATQNILLAIHSIGLGGVWCGVKQGSEFYKGITKEFSLPNHIRPVSLIAFGYPGEEKIQSNRFEFDKIHFESW